MRSQAQEFSSETALRGVKSAAALDSAEWRGLDFDRRRYAAGGLELHGVVLLKVRAWCC
jgi:hypothetical protein